MEILKYTYYHIGFEARNPTLAENVIHFLSQLLETQSPVGRYERVSNSFPSGGHPCKQQTNYPISLDKFYYNQTTSFFHHFCVWIPSIS